MIRILKHLLLTFLFTAATPWTSAQVKAVSATESAELLFYASFAQGLSADFAKGEAAANFADQIELIDNGPAYVKQSSTSATPAIHWPDSGVLAWPASGNLIAERGTLSFFWRAGYAPDDAPFVIFRAGYADHSSWDMAWMRIDWNGAGFDAFVTDANLARTRVSSTLSFIPDPSRWYHLVLTWDELRGVALYLDGQLLGQASGPVDSDGKLVNPAKKTFLDFDTGLDSFGFAGRVLSPHQVQSRYNFLRGGDIAHLSIFDGMLEAESVKALGQILPSGQMAARDPREIEASKLSIDYYSAWMSRFNWHAQLPPKLPNNNTRIRKIEFTDARDLKQWMFKGVDGISETTWPGVYNRSRLPGRNDYFQLPDWNTYVQGGLNYDLTLPNEPVNLVEIRGAAYGQLQYKKDPHSTFKTLSKRSAHQTRTSHSVDVNGGVLRFSNTAQETPIQEIWAYHLSQGDAPQGVHRLKYSIDSTAKADYTNLDSLNTFIQGRFPKGAQQTLVALPQGASLRRAVNRVFDKHDLPLVHVLIPSSVSHHPAEKSVTRSWAYGWENSYDGLDGIELTLPAMNLAPTRNGLIAFNVQIKDPIWPERNMLDVSFSIKPNQEYKIWLDLRDRILTDDSFYLTFASSAPNFTGEHLQGAQIQLVFKEREQAKAEHITDRFNQVKDNWGNLVEEHTSSQRMALYRRAHADVTDLLRVDPDHDLGRLYWYYMSFKSQRPPQFAPLVAPAGVPFWAYAQIEQLKLVRHFVNWWIDNRQVEFGDFGGGISDDTDMVQQWPGLALMGVDREKVTQSLINLSYAVDKEGTMLNGLSTIETDELHVYEEGINSNSALFTLLMGDPVAAARLLETVRALPQVIKPNPFGNTLFSSNWYGGKKIYTGPNWEWQKPYSFYVLHPAFLLGEYSGHKPSQELVSRLAEGYLAHAYTDEDGRFTLPNEINWRTGEVRGGELNRGAGSADLVTVFSAAHEWTGDDKFLKGLDYRIARGGPAQLHRLNDNFLDRLNPSGEWRKQLTQDAAVGTSLEKFTAWETTGDTRYLDDLYRQEIYYKKLHQYFHTEGHWWTDRVDTRADYLQKARLGGVALVRNKMVPGNTLSWAFNGDEALDVAILMPRPTREKFTIIGYNLAAKSIQARAEGYLVKTGLWRMQVGEDRDGDGKIDKVETTRDVTFGRFEQLPVSFKPNTTTIITMELINESKQPNNLADLALSTFDIDVRGRTITLGVHNIGNANAKNIQVQLEHNNGDVISTQTINKLGHPDDSQVKREVVEFTLDKTIDAEDLVVRVLSNQPEITTHNNLINIRDRRAPLQFN
ncbi:MAG: LamG-like jellyroll fold domain-containing protein [Cellvibrio sp.]